MTLAKLKTELQQAVALDPEILIWLHLEVGRHVTGNADSFLGRRRRLGLYKKQTGPRNPD